LISFHFRIQIRLHMATVFKKANSRYWYAQFYNSSGVRVARSTGKEKKRDAQKVAEDFESEDRLSEKGRKDISKDLKLVVDAAAREAEVGLLTLARAEELINRLKRIANPDFKELSVLDAWEKWIGIQERHVGESYVKSLQDGWKFFGKHLGKKVCESPLSDLKEGQIRSAMTKSTDEGRRASTVNKIFLDFRRCLEWTVSQKWINANPARQVRTLPETDSKETGPFTVEEVQTLVKTANEEWSGAILIAAHTGLRMGDICKLSPDHVEDRRLVIRPSKTSKSKKTVTIPLSDDVVGWLERKKGIEGLFFPVMEKSGSAQRATFFRRLMEKAKVPREVTAPGGIVLNRSFHSLRHTFTSWLADADVQADVRQRLTGHSSAKIHQRYTHHDEALDRAVEKLPSLHSPSPTEA
jgi:integrase